MRSLVCLAALAACAAPAPAPAPVPPVPSPRVVTAPAEPSAFEACVGEAVDASAFARFASEEEALADAEAEVARGRAERAAQTLRALARSSAVHAIALRASLTYLDALNQIAVRAGKPQCYDVMAEATPQLAARHCPADRSPPEDEASCAMLAAVTCDIQALHERGTLGDGTLGERDRARELADAHMALWRRFGEPRVRRHLAPWCRMYEILYNAMRAYRAAGAEDDAERAAALLRAGWPGSPRIRARR